MLEIKKEIYKAIRRKNVSSVKIIAMEIQKNKTNQKSRTSRGPPVSEMQVPHPSTGFTSFLFKSFSVSFCIAIYLSFCD
jgi:hypothetical protein